MSKTCLFCAWWCCTVEDTKNKFGKLVSYGECRRYPPTRFVLGAERSGWSIMTDNNDWCGEFKVCPEWREDQEG